MKPAPCLLALLLMFGLPAAADQSDPRLDGLFAALQTSTDTAQAAQLTGQILQLWQANPDPRVNALMDQGISALAQNRLAVALDRFSRVTGLAPGFAEGWNKLATVNFRLGNLPASARQVEKTLALEPRHFGAIGGRGMIRLALGQPFDAAADWRRALQLNPFLSDLREQLEALERELLRNTVSVLAPGCHA
ncbi:tetratricopeptide repeat protein [Granulosicoccaceae sp. 1_MG-2023]|nr:tetratricopeptide repeat protein [Granulosicoccaceae sp. 1_MG-2023]